MKAKPSPKHNNEPGTLRSAAQAALALALLGLGWMMWDTREQSNSFSSLKPVATNGALAPLTIERINRHMQFTEKKSELRAMAMEAENFEMGARLKPGDFGTDDTRVPTPGNPFESENTASKVYRDIDPSRAYDTPALPEDRVTSMLEQEQWMNKYDKKQTDAFVNQVRANARAAGYELEINDQLQVVKVHRLPNSVAPPTAIAPTQIPGQPAVAN